MGIVNFHFLLMKSLLPETCFRLLMLLPFFFLYKWSAQFYLGTMVLDILLYISLQYLGKSMC